MLRGVDLSNLQGPPAAYRDQQWYRDAQFVIVQCIRPPQPYNGWDHVDSVFGGTGYTGEQMQAARDDGKYVGAYAFLWNTLADPYSDMLARFNIVPTWFPLDMRPWSDIEDETLCPVAQRQDAVSMARQAGDDFAQARGLPPGGGYSRDEYITDFLGGFWPTNWVYWQANYSAGTTPVLLPMRPMVQYTSTPIDSDAMLESELVNQPAPQPENPCAGLISSLGYIGGDLLVPVARLKLMSQPKAVQALVAGIRSQCDQQGINHA